VKQESTSKIKVWDLPVRVIHWSLALAVLGAWLTQEIERDWFAWHTRFGYSVLVLVVTRLVWGFIGTRYARFADFIRGPRAVIDYVSRGFGRSKPTLGHNPLGAWAVLLMLTLLLVQAITGLFANDQIFQTGPLFGYVTAATSDQLTTVHKRLFDVLWVVIVIHIIAAFLYLLLRKENLIAPMFTGKKAISASQGEDAAKDAAKDAESLGITRSRSGLALLVLVLCAALLAWIVSTAPEAFLFTF
jgi:cytochrome b